jgi:hypothetical protein
MVVLLSPSIHLLDVRQFPKSRPVIFYLGEAQKVLMQINCEAADPDGSVAVPLSTSGLDAKYSSRVDVFRFAPDNRHGVTAPP